MLLRLRRIELKNFFLSYTKPTDELRQRQLDQIVISLKQAYNHYSQQDIPEKIFEILFNHTLTTAQNTASNNDQAKQSKDEICRLLWEIIEAKCEKKGSVIQWIPGLAHYPALNLQLLRVRFPSSEPDVFLPGCIKYDMKYFIKYTSA